MSSESVVNPFRPELWDEVAGFEFTDITYHRAKNVPAVRIAFDRPEDARTLLSRPLGNHHMVVGGDWTHQINAYCDYFCS